MIKKVSGTLEHGKLPVGSLAVIASLRPRQRKADVLAWQRQRLADAFRG